VHYFIAADKQADLPAWKDFIANDKTDADGFMKVSDTDMEDMPF
jgi:hypothetical protein